MRRVIKYSRATCFTGVKGGKNGSIFENEHIYGYFIQMWNISVFMNALTRESVKSREKNTDI